MAWFFRVIELPDGRWACRRGSTEIDGHPMLEDAVEHMTTMASYEGNAELFLHRLDGRVERVREADRSPTPRSVLDFEGRS
jgi:undecaprenyl pyrophosphate synthase